MNTDEKKESSLKKVLEYMTGSDLERHSSFLTNLHGLVDYVTAYHDPYSGDGRELRIKTYRGAKEFNPFWRYVQRFRIPLYTSVAGMTFNSMRELSAILCIVVADRIMTEVSRAKDMDRLEDCFGPAVEEYRKGNHNNAIELLEWDALLEKGEI